MRVAGLSRPFLLLSLIVCLVPTIDGTAAAAAPGPKWSATSLEQADADYPFQGEFLGTLGYVARARGNRLAFKWPLRATAITSPSSIRAAFPGADGTAATRPTCTAAASRTA